MKRLKHTHENQRETEEDNNKDKLRDLPNCILHHILSLLNVKDAVQTCVLSTRWEHLWRSLPKEDKLSNLPDSALFHILSFLNAKDAVQTCLLSTRWKHLWRRLPTLTFNYSDFRSHESFIKFVNMVLSLRDTSTPLNALDYFKYHYEKPSLVNRIVRYAISHNVNRLHLVCDFNRSPPSLFSCPSLTSLALECLITPLIFPDSLNFPALTYLKLVYFSFCSGNEGMVEPFSTFNKLNTLILERCKVQGEKPLYISSTTILNLSIRTMYNPQDYSNFVLFAPSLCTFAFTGNTFHKFTMSHLSSIKQFSIDLLCEKDYHVESSLCLLNWLKEINEIKSLNVTLTTLQALSLIPDILKLKLPFLCTMKSLKLNLSWDARKFSASSLRDIKMELAGGKSWKENPKLPEAIKAGLYPRYSSIMDGMIDFLLQNSPYAKVDITY